MKKIIKITVILALALIMLLGAASCSCKKELWYQRGAWNKDRTVFTNAWSDIKFTINPDLHDFLTDQEIAGRNKGIEK